MTNEACFKCQRSLLHLQFKSTSFFELKKTNKKAYQSKRIDTHKYDYSVKINNRNASLAQQHGRRCS